MRHLMELNKIAQHWDTLYMSAKSCPKPVLNQVLHTEKPNIVLTVMKPPSCSPLLEDWLSSLGLKDRKPPVRLVAWFRPPEIMDSDWHSMGVNDWWRLARKPVWNLWKRSISPAAQISKQHVPPWTLLTAWPWRPLASAWSPNWRSFSH